MAQITPANHYFLNSIFANVARQVRIGNTRGSFTAIADVSDRSRLGTVASTKGY